MSADKLIADARQVPRLQKQLAEARKREAALLGEIERLRRVPKVAPIATRKGKAAKHFVRLIVPDSHGAHVEPAVAGAMVADAKLLQPSEVVWLGDHLDAGGTFSAHQRSYTNELSETYADDVASANALLDAVQQAAPDARYYYLFGNHEQHVERWAAREFQAFADARFVLDRVGPAAVLGLVRRGFSVYTQAETYMGLSVPGTIRLGKCYFTHGMSHAKHAASVHLQRVGANVVFGHVHRVQSIGERTVTSDGFGAWCPGTLAKLQPLYKHTAPSSWQHGYALQFVNASTGTFVHFNVPIVKGESLMRSIVEAVK